MPFITGILFGLSTLLFIGPVFFYLLKSSIEKSFKAGFAVALGIITGDIICVFLSLYGAGKYLEMSIVQYWFAGIGGSLLILMGLKYVLKPSIDYQKKHKKSSDSLFVYFINGFIINFVNPFVFAVWFGFYSYSTTKYDSDYKVTTVLITTLLVIFITDILKAYFSHRIKEFINPKRLHLLYKVFGIIMIGFGIRLILLLF